MKPILMVLSACLVGFGLAGCETTRPGGGNNDGVSFPDPDASRTAAEVQQTHSQLQRGRY